MPTGIDFNAAFAPLMKGLAHSKKERDAYDQQLAIARMMSQMAVKDGTVTKINPEVKDKAMEPLFSQKAVDQIANNANLKRAEKTGQLKTLTGIGELMLRHQITKSVQDSDKVPVKIPGTDIETRVAPETALNAAISATGSTTRSNIAEKKREQQIISSQNKGFDTALKGLGFTSRNDLFDSKMHQGGTIDPNTGVFAQTPEDKQTHVRIGFQEPQGKDNRGRPIGGRAGALISRNDLEAYQEQAASLAGPDALAALKWLRSNPGDKRVPKVQKTFSQLIAQSASPAVPDDSNESPPKDDEEE